MTDSYIRKNWNLTRVLLLALFLNSAPILAGQYELVKGKGDEVCEAYGKNLNADPEPPVRLCERKIMPGFEVFQKPAWQKLDVYSHRHLILAIEKYLARPLDYKATKSTYPADTTEENIFDYYIESKMSLSLADLDIDNDGAKEPVVKYESSYCSQWDIPSRPEHWKGPLLVLKPDRQALDIEKTYLLMQNEGKTYLANKDEIDEWFRTKYKLGVDLKGRPASVYKPSKYAPGVTSAQGYDVFLYKDNIFFDKWDEARDGGSYQTLTVYQTHTKQTKELCQYQFKR